MALVPPYGVDAKQFYREVLVDELAKLGNGIRVKFHGTKIEKPLFFYDKLRTGKEIMAIGHGVTFVGDHPGLAKLMNVPCKIMCFSFVFFP